jgi:predicted  nucleic acid-binding Zn-ribbon protein
MKNFEKLLSDIKYKLDDLESEYELLLNQKEELEEELEDRDNIIDEKNDEIYELKQRLEK